MSKMEQEEKPSKVPKAKLEGASQRWSWVKPEAWSSTMLAALERGVKGDAWYTLIDKIYRVKNLEEAYASVKKNGGSAGVDHVSIERYGEQLCYELSKLASSLRANSYEPQDIKRVHIPKADGGRRPLGIPTVRDRVVQAAVRQVIEPIFENEFLDCSYGFRPGRGCKDALRQVDSLLRQGYTVVVDADVKAFFDTINHELLMGLVKRKITDSHVLQLIERFLKQGILEDGVELGASERGTPQGGVISPLLANIYLHQLDIEMTKHGCKLIRYADDFVIMCQTEQQAQDTLEVVKSIMSTLKLELHAGKTSIVDMRELQASFEFLGYRFKNHKGKIRRDPRAKSLSKLKDKIRRITPSRSGQSLDEIISTLNQSLHGWYEYFKHSSSYSFKSVDAWIRARLRAILSRRRKSGNRNRYGLSHMRWPNQFFETQGLFCMTNQHWSMRRQSALR